MANLSTGKYLVMYGVEVQINTTPSANSATYAVIGDGCYIGRNAKIKT